jgi:hypothetical protein
VEEAVLGLHIYYVREEMHREALMEEMEAEVAM